MSAEFKPRYRTPTTSVDVDVSLDEFNLEEIAQYLRHNGYEVSGTPATVTEDGAPNVFDPEDLNHIYTLALCGQLKVAQIEALQLVSQAIGRPLGEP